jgi:transcriptional regulator with XRE-family HTH domain
MSKAIQGRLGPALRKFRESRGSSGKEFAAAAGMSQGHLSEIENGRRNLTEALIDRIAESVSLSPADLVDTLSSFLSADPVESPPRFREDPSPYHYTPHIQPGLPPPDEYLELATWFVSQLPPSKAWELVRDFTALAENGDLAAARRARALIFILTRT